MSYSLCVVIPAYNEEHAIGDTIRDYKAAFPRARLVVIDNNSTDRTAAVASAALIEGRDLLLTERRQGKGAAVKAGFSRILADIYIMVDGDSTYPAQDAAHLVAILEKQRCDMVVGDRLSSGAYMKQNTRAGHSFGNRFLTRFVSFLAGQQYSDVFSGLRVMSRPFVNMLDFRSAGFQLETELNVIAAYVRAAVVEEPINYLQRPDGSESKLNTIRDGAKIIWFALINWIAFYPLYSFGLLSSIAFLMSAVIGARLFAIYLDLGQMPYSATAIAAAAAGLVGVQSMFAGLTLHILRRDSRRRDVARLIEMRREWNLCLDA